MDGPKQDRDIPLKMKIMMAGVPLTINEFKHFLFDDKYGNDRGPRDWWTKLAAALRSSMNKDSKKGLYHMEMIFVEVRRAFDIVKTAPIETLRACSALEFLDRLPKKYQLNARETLAPTWESIKKSDDKTASPSKPGDLASAVVLNETAGDVIQNHRVQFIDCVFPDHLEHITKLVATTQNSLRIMADCVDYGSFSDPHLYKDLLHEITSVLTKSPHLNRTVEMLITCSPEPISKSSPFYGKTFDDLMKEEEFRSVFEPYCKIHENLIHRQPRNDIEFSKMLQKQQKESFRALKLAGPGARIRGLNGKEITKLSFRKAVWQRHVKKASSPNSYELFFWIVDQKKAIFLLVNSPSNASNMAFQTDDSIIIARFGRIFEQHWNKR